eukprot:TRINITY_DN1498_c0_g1_i3.p1 TRINITY_DN1498_c0_g1~~TRINITY_DN1498_c0_g1_i3.p1  ORF type:complete len:208 (-),score=28.64 TRINITY_DN1498_c0_g1_i3:261-884(-)
MKQNQPDACRFGYKLEPGVSVRLGRAHFTVKEVFHSPSPKQQMIEEISKEQGECRICAGSESTSDNPLISPCKCTGTIKLVHIKCMQAWHQSKTLCEHTASSALYTIYKLQCELCNTTLPLALNCAGKTYELVSVERPESEYVMLESVFGSTRQIYVVGMKKQEVTIVSCAANLGEDGRMRRKDQCYVCVKSTCHAATYRRKHLLEC